MKLKTALIVSSITLSFTANVQASCNSSCECSDPTDVLLCEIGGLVNHYNDGMYGNRRYERDYDRERNAIMRRQLELMEEGAQRPPLMQPLMQPNRFPKTCDWIRGVWTCN